MARRAIRVVLAPNAFKGTFNAVEVADAWAAELSAGRFARVDRRPMTDGGDGFLAVVRHYRPRVLEVRARVPDPLGRPVEAGWGWEIERHTAYVESAAVIGLRYLAADERRPLEVDTAGLGRLLRVASSLGVRRLVIGLGGSATVDGGLGMARALGFRFEDRRGKPIRGPAELPRLSRITPPEAPPLGTQEDGRLRPPIVTALADVDHPLLGPRGAAAVFGPQKGATPAEVPRLEEGLSRLAERWVADLGASRRLCEARGAGAAGGLGAALRVFLGARLVAGSGWCARLAGLARALEAADLVVTGEGRLDRQSFRGKGTGYVISRARRYGLPIAVVTALAELPAEDLGPSLVLVDHRDLVGEAGATPQVGGDLSLEELGRLARLAVGRLHEART